MSTRRVGGVASPDAVGVAALVGMVKRTSTAASRNELRIGHYLGGLDRIIGQGLGKWNLSGNRSPAAFFPLAIAASNRAALREDIVNAAERDGRISAVPTTASPPASAMNRLLPIAVLCQACASPAAMTNGNVDCNLGFDMKGWSLVYNAASGAGTVTGNNGQTVDVTVSAKGGGLSGGKQKIEGGTGDFSGVNV